MTDSTSQTVVGRVVGDSISQMRVLPGGWVEIPVDCIDAVDRSRVVLVHAANFPGMTGMGNWLLSAYEQERLDRVNARLNSRQQAREDYASAVRGGVEQAARDAGMGPK